MCEVEQQCGIRKNENLYSSRWGRILEENYVQVGKQRSRHLQFMAIMVGVGVKTRTRA